MQGPLPHVFLFDRLYIRRPVGVDKRKSFLLMLIVFKLSSTPLLPISPRLALMVLKPEVVGIERGKIRLLVVLE